MRVPLRLPCATALLLACAALSATQTRFANSASQDLTTGWSDGVRVLPEGALVPGVRFTKGAEFAGTALCALRRGDELFVGTGSTGDLLRLRGGRVELLHHFAEPLVSALAPGPGETVFVGTSGPAKIYSVALADGTATEVATLPGQYCWGLLTRGETLLAAAGVPGGLYRVRPGGAPVPVADPKAQHVRCLLAEGERIWFGTASPAALFVLEGEKTRRVASFEGEELASLAASRGSIFAALNEKADASTPAPPKEGSTPSVEPGRGSLFEVPPGGAPRRTATFPAALLCVAAPEGELLAGTRDGGLYAVGGAGAALVARWEAAPVSALPAAGKNWWVVTAAPGAIWLPGAPREGRFDAPVLDAGSPAVAMALEGAGEGSFALSVRGGDGPLPDAFWSEWLPAARVSELAPARFLQWRAELKEGAVVRGVRLAFRPQNRPPLLESVQVAPPGQIQVKDSSQLGERLVQELHAKDRPFPSLAQSMPASGGTPSTYYLQGFRMVTFAASDPDGDEVRVDLSLKPEGGGEWILLAEDVADPFFVFESRALPDGRYQLKVVARDDAGNPEGEALSVERVLPVFSVDNTAPVLERAGTSPGLLRLALSDGDAVRAARYCLDGAPWVPLAAERGALGGPSATVAVPLPKSGRHWLAVEAVDAQGNRAVRGWIVP